MKEDRKKMFHVSPQGQGHKVIAIGDCKKMCTRSQKKKKNSNCKNI